MSVYQSIYDLIVEYVYGNPETLDNFQQLVTTEMATVASFAVMALPLICVFWLCKFVFTIGRSW